jgi:hypothetical protein
MMLVMVQQILQEEIYSGGECMYNIVLSLRVSGRRGAVGETALGMRIEISAVPRREIFISAQKLACDLHTSITRSWECVA